MYPPTDPFIHLYLWTPSFCVWLHHLFIYPSWNSHLFLYVLYIVLHGHLSTHTSSNPSAIYSFLSIYFCIILSIYPSMQPASCLPVISLPFHLYDILSIQPSWSIPFSCHMDPFPCQTLLANAPTCYFLNLKQQLSACSHTHTYMPLSALIHKSFSPWFIHLFVHWLIIHYLLIYPGKCLPTNLFILSW